MAAVVSVVAASLASLTVESLLYGMFFILFWAATYLMITRHRRLQRGSFSSIALDPLVVASVLLFGGVTTHWIINVYRAFMGFIYFQNGAIPLIYFASLEDPTEVTKSALLVFVVTVADLVQMYRVWMVWDHNIWIMIAPIISFLAGLTCGIGVVVSQSHFNILIPIYESSMNKWIAGSCVADLCTNFICCGLIVWRLWRISSARSLKLLWVFSVFIESAALYASWNIVYVATYEAGSDVMFTIVDAWVPIAGISFMLINVRVGMGYVLKPTSGLSELSWTPAARASALDTTPGVPLSAVVNVTRRVESDADPSFSSDTKYPRSRSYGSAEAV